MEKQGQVAPTPQKAKPTSIDSDHPKHSTVPRYSQKFKDIIAQSASLKKYYPQQVSETKQKTPTVKAKKDFFFFRVRSIGVGAHSFVFLVQEDESKLLLAEKTVSKEHAREISDDLLREIKLLSFLEHENIIKLYYVYASETHVNLVTEFAEDSLFALKQRFGIFKEKEAIQVTRQLLLALQYLHSKQIVHADIKLENIMIANGTVKVCDFGLAHLKGKYDHKPGQVVGTLEYLSPEYAQGVDSGYARDIWAVGILAFEMAMGKHPFEGLKQNQKWSKLVKNPPRKFLEELEEMEKKQKRPIPKIIQLLRGIFVEWEDRWSADKLLSLSFFNNN